MKRLTFLVNCGENDCYMVHGLDWATYVEGTDWDEVTQTILNRVGEAFACDSRPAYLDFKFPDGSVVSLCA